MPATYDAESAVTATAPRPIALLGPLGDPAAEYRSDAGGIWLWLWVCAGERMPV